MKEELDQNTTFGHINMTFRHKYIYKSSDEGISWQVKA